ncbi:class I SAM-dependent methyltransferase [Shinella sp.]|uniref:class I SAM-dependent methyltransferase n=1 Tax=Shinella sp. TaxID=1870904 RepID=UPI0028A19EA0|nr:class I SAM-dependent methyltransferase [Shinella sp.]
MERLHFGSNERYIAIEAAVHLARYSMARPFADGKRVLDIACGEGYGAYALATRWNAAHVTALDIAPEAIASAKHNFSADNIEFGVASAYDLSKIFPENSFDLIVSFETIEHLEDPERFLREIKKVVAPDATIIISCPNDPRHYDEGDVGNPFHMRTFTASEFFGLTNTFLGPARKRFIGTPVTGFGNYAVDTEGLKVGRNPVDMVRGELVPAVAALTVAPDDHLEMDSSSYYVGIWGPPDIKDEEENVTIYPCDLKSAAQADLADEVGRLRTKIWDLQRASEKLLSEKVDELETVHRLLRAEALRTQALAAENVLAKKSIQALTGRADSNEPILAAVRWRIVGVYRRVRRFIPKRALNFAAKIIDKARR